MSFSSLDHVKLVCVLNGVMTELSMDCGEVNTGLLCLKVATARHVGITMDGSGEREGGGKSIDECTVSGTCTFSF